jgi:hypothetical protein
VKNFLDDIMKFSTQKYSSNIIEKCMDCCDEETKELITQKYCEPQIIEKLLFDMYGNYVLQKVMNVSKEPLTNKYISYVGPLMKNLSSYSFGPKLYNKLISSFPCLSNYAVNRNDSGKIKRNKNKKKNINDVNNGLNDVNKNNNNDIYGNKRYNYNKGNNINMMGMIEQNRNNKFQNIPMFNPGMNNNFYMPFQFQNDMNNHQNNNMMFQGMMNNANYGMNYGNGNNMNTGSKLMYNYNKNNNQQ